jgi:hypothetical protein
MWVAGNQRGFSETRLPFNIFVQFRLHLQAGAP